MESNIVESDNILESKDTETSLEYKILASGSKGNAVIIEDVLVDCGIPYKELRDHLYGIKYLLLTHIHTDHVKGTTYRKLRTEFPHIKTIGNYEVHQVHGVDIICNHGLPIETEKYTFIPIELEHDVITHGFNWNVGENEIIYATDTSSLDKAPNKRYDYLFLESNYDPIKIEQVRGKSSGRYKPYLEAMRHLSSKQCREFYYLNRRSRDSVLVELHKSSRFY